MCLAEYIVAFNNDFFTAAREALKEFFQREGGEGNLGPLKIDRAFGDVFQLGPDLPGKEGGYVRATMIPKEEGADWKANVHLQVVRLLEQLQDQGLISISGQQIHILDTQGLEELTY